MTCDVQILHNETILNFLKKIINLILTFYFSTFNQTAVYDYD